MADKFIIYDLDVEGLLCSTAVCSVVVCIDYIAYMQVANK